jgi:hypothetical protein
MRRTALAAAAALAALAALAAPATAATAPQVTDPAGDATYAGIAAAAASDDALDLTAVRWWADDAAQHVTLTLVAPDAGRSARYVVRAATPSCATVTLTWQTGAAESYLEGCGRRRWYAAPRFSATGLTFRLPRTALPSWLAPGTTLSGLGATTAPVTTFVVGQLHPAVDDAASETRYVVGS